VFSKERSEKDWDIFMNRWTALTPKQRVRVYSDLEAQLLNLVNERSKERPDSDIFSAEHVSLLQTRVENHKPVLLIDIPGDRPGSDVPLYYVIEAQRRALRRDDRVIGEVYPSDVWKDFGEGLRSRAGKVRVFCHPTVVDILEAAIDRGDFVSMFESQTRN